MSVVTIPSIENVCGSHPVKTLLAMALVLPMIILSGCTGNAEIPALTKPGVDPPAEKQKDWMEESRKHGSAPKNVKPPKTDANPKTDTKKADPK